jgi:hypothetical protein
MERDSQITEEINPREVILAYLEKERVAAMTAPDGVERMNARTRIDTLLDELGALGVKNTLDSSE